MADNDELRASRMARLEEMRSQAFALRTPLGNLLSRTFELMTTVVRDGVRNDESVGYALESLSGERVIAMRRDVDSNEPFRRLIYELTESFGTTFHSIMEELGAKNESPLPDQDCDSTFSPFADGEILFKVEDEDIAEMDQAVPEETTTAYNVQTEQPTLPHSVRQGEKRGSSDVGAPETPQPSAKRSCAERIAKVIEEEERTPDRQFGSENDRRSSAAVAANAADEVHLCDQCDRSFPTSRGLTEHYLQHTSKRCPECDKYFTEEDIERHMKEEHGKTSASHDNGWIQMGNDKDAEGPEDSFTQTDADAADAADAVYEVHPCDQCDRSFLTLSGLTRHQLHHTSTRCIECNKYFEKDLIQKHIEEVHRSSGNARDRSTPMNTGEMGNEESETTNGETSNHRQTTHDAP